MTLAQVKESALRMLMQGKKKVTEVEKRVQTLNDLVTASDPDLILRKGFTLTLDDQDRVVKTLQAFKTLKRGTLKFSDGTTRIKEEES